jgi:hypothetical protein
MSALLSAVAAEHVNDLRRAACHDRKVRASRPKRAWPSRRAVARPVLCTE